MTDYYIGCSGFYYRDWVGRFYPKGTSPKMMLPYYGEKFNTVEINATFYRFPSEKMIRSLIERTKASFLFSIKANRLFTHLKKLSNVAGSFARFYSLLSPLKETGKLGAILFQLPESFPANPSLLSDFLAILPDDEFDITFEFRHPSWENEEVISLLKAKNADFAAISGPGIKPFTIPIAHHKYFRFHGATRMYHYNYSEKELREWAKVIKGISGKVKRIYCYFNNDPEAYAPKNASFLITILKEEEKGG